MITDILDRAIDEISRYQARYRDTNGPIVSASEKLVVILRAAQRSFDLDPKKLNNQGWRVIEAFLELDTSALERLLKEPLTGTTFTSNTENYDKESMP